MRRSAAIAVAVACAAFAACTCDVQDEQAMEAVQSDIETVVQGTYTDSTYENPAARVRLKAPRGWKFTRPRKPSRVMVAGLRNGEDLVPADMFTVELHGGYVARDAAGMIDEKISVIRSFFRKMEVIRRETVTVAGREAGLLVYSINPAGSAPVSRLYLVPHGDQVVELLFVEPESDDTALAAVIGQVLQSLELY